MFRKMKLINYAQFQMFNAADIFNYLVSLKYFAGIEFGWVLQLPFVH